MTSAGMASVWDYDLVLMLVSHLVEAVTLHRDGKALRAGRVLRVPVRNALEFCHRGLGGNQVHALADALQRLGTTRIKQVCTSDGMPVVTLDAPPDRRLPDPCLSPHWQGRVSGVTVAEWMYQEVLNGSPSRVTTLSPAYFRITSGIGRFLYRLARHVAGNRSALCSFQTLYACSGSLGSRNEFNRILRALIQANDLPDYLLSEEKGKAGAMLRMVHRSRAGKRRGRPCNGA